MNVFEPIEGDLDLIRVPVRARSNGEVRQYELVEMDGIRYSQWLIEFRRLRPGKATAGPDGGVAVDLEKMDMGGFQESLLALCLFDPQKQEWVSREEISHWPSSFRQKLFSRCRQINGLDEREGEGKNSSTPVNGAGSDSPTN